MLKIKNTMVAGLASVMLCSNAAAQLADVRHLGGRKKIAMAAEVEAKKIAGMCHCHRGRRGHLVYLQRIDGTQTGSIDVAIKRHRPPYRSSAPQRFSRTRWPAVARSSSRYRARCRSRGAFPLQSVDRSSALSV